MTQTIVGLVLLGGSMFGLGFLLCMWLVFGPTVWFLGDDDPADERR